MSKTAGRDMAALARRDAIGVTPDQGFGKAAAWQVLPGDKGSNPRVIFGLFRKSKPPEATRILFERVVEAAREPGLYIRAGVPDTFEGRFESLVIHAFLVMHRLRQLPDPATAAAQDFIDHVFEHIDLGLRQAGISDVGVPKRMKKLAQGFYGRIEAYDAAVNASDRSALEAALARNVTAGQSPAVLADYLTSGVEELAACNFEEVLTRSPIINPLKS